MLLCQIAVTRVRKGTEKGDTLPCLPLLSTKKKIKREVHDCVSLYKHSCLQKITSSCCIGHYQKHYALYLIFFSLPAQFFNESQTFVLVLRIIWIKVVVKEQTCQSQIFLFFRDSHIPRKLPCEKVRISICNQSSRHYIPVVMVVICDSSWLESLWANFQT